MKLIDYLHYYLGCDYWTNNSQGNLNAKTLPDVIGMCERGKGAQLHLRRMEDMTEGEALHIGRLAFFDRDMGYPDSDYQLNKTRVMVESPSAYSVAINNDWYEMEIRIGFNSGNVWRVGPHSHERIYNQPKIFRYLLQQHFDLFGLIDAGIAIDAKTIKS